MRGHLVSPVYVYMGERELNLSVREGASGIICRGELKLLKPSVERRERKIQASETSIKYQN